MNRKSQKSTERPKKNIEKKTDPDETEKLLVKVVGQDHKTIQFKILKSHTLATVMEDYYARLGLQMHAVRFCYEGQPVSENDTPMSLKMEHGDSIEVYLQLVGGGSM